MIYKKREQQLFIDLLNNHFESEKIVANFVICGTLTAEEMIEEINKGSDIGNQYCSDIVRIARDSNYKQPLKNDTNLIKPRELLDSTVFIDALNEIDEDEVIYEDLKAEELIDELKKETEAAQLYRTLMMCRIIRVVETLAKSHEK